MRVGINYPWFNYGWDFGAPPVSDAGYPWGPRAAWRDVIDADLASLRRLGLFAARWFVLGDGANFGSGDARPRLDGDRWRFAPPRLSDDALADFAALLDRFRASGLMLWPVLLDFDFCKAGEPIAGTSRFVKQGRSDVIVDPAARAAFLDGTLAPLLDLTRNYRDVVDVWELINEPEFCTEEEHGPVPVPAMRDFIRDGVGRINAAGFRSTVGFAGRPSIDDWDSHALNISFHQFHYYGNPPRLPKQEFDPAWPLIVGEFATSTVAPHHWPELGGAQDVANRLRHIESRGFPLAFLWATDRAERAGRDPAIDWSDVVQQGIMQYTLPPAAAVS